MILPSTVILTMDNSGARRVRCIRIYKKPALSFAKVGDLILSIVVRLRTKGLINVKRGEFVNAVVVRITFKIFRKTLGYFLKFDCNAVVLISKKGLPLGTRLFGPCSRELKKKGYTRIISLCSTIL